MSAAEKQAVRLQAANAFRRQAAPLENQKCSSCMSEFLCSTCKIQARMDELAWLAAEMRRQAEE